MISIFSNFKLKQKYVGRFRRNNYVFKKIKQFCWYDFKKKGYQNLKIEKYLNYSSNVN